MLAEALNVMATGTCANPFAASAVGLRTKRLPGGQGRGDRRAIVRDERGAVY